MDPSVLLRAYKAPQWPDPIEEYKGFLSLRQMMDLGKLRQVQLKQNELENLQKQQALDDARRLREALAGGIPEDAPLSTYLQRFGEEGVKIYSAIRQAKSAESTRQTAELTRQEKAADLTRKRGQSLADLGTATLQLPEDQRQAYWDEAWGLPVDRPPTAPQVQADIARYYGSEKQQTMANARDERAEKAALYPYQVTKAIAEANKAVQESTGTQPLSTYQQRVLENQETPDSLVKLEIALANPKLSPEKRAQLQAARPALIELEKQRHAGTANPEREAAIAEGIMNGEGPPTTTGLYGAGPGVRAYLSRKGYNLAQAQLDWEATKKHIATLNGPQQERLRQAISFTYDSLDNIEQLYNRWKELGGASGYRILNRATLAASKQGSGELGKTAQLLEAQINDLTSELATVYKGGNSSTDEGLRLASENLKSEWNEQTFRAGLNQIRQNLHIRRNSMLNSQPAGVSPNSQYQYSSPESAPASAPTGKRKPLSSFEK